jgi:amino acid transporter
VSGTALPYDPAPAGRAGRTADPTTDRREGEAVGPAARTGGERTGDGVPGTRAAVKRAVLGRPRSSRELGQQLLPRWQALPVFSSDPLSSVAYATQELLLVLVLAGTGALALAGPLAAGIAILLVIVIASHRQSVRAYPQGGGAYVVARENLGTTPGLVAAGALLVDYTLTVAVSVAAGVAAIVAALPELAGARVPIALGLVALVALANLRGVREASVLLAMPTYAFVAVMLTLVAVGVGRCALGTCPQAASAGVDVAPQQALTALLVLRAFSIGATALAGVEAVSNGVTAFRYPQARNAAATLAIMGGIAVTLFLGITYLAVATSVVPAGGGERTVVAQIALAVLGDGVGFYAVQVVTALILVLAANTAFASFPRLASVLARDRWLPRQLVARGDRLVFSNGIIVLSVAAMALVAAYGADVSALIQLYVVGVFISFTLSQAGMVRHWLRVRGPGWRGSVALNGVGAAATGVVLVVVAATQLLGGAWLVLVAIPLLVVLMRGISRHYAAVSLALRSHVADAATQRPHHAVILIDRVDESAARAVSYALGTGARSVAAIAVPVADEDVAARWAALAPSVTLEVLQPAASRGAAAAIVGATLRRAREHGPEATTNAIIAETLSRSWVEQVTQHRLALRVKQRLVGEGDLAVTDLTAPFGGPGPYTVEEPVEHHVVVLVSAVSSATLRALRYAQGLRATSVRALSVNLDAEVSTRILAAWDDWGIDVPLEVVDAPFRSLTGTVRAYVRDFAPDGRHTVVTCVLPEFVLDRWYHQPLHNQSALLVKAALLFERGVVTTSVPYHLGRALADADAPTADDARRR